MLGFGNALAEAALADPVGNGGVIGRVFEWIIRARRRGRR